MFDTSSESESECLHAIKKFGSANGFQDIDVTKEETSDVILKKSKTSDFRFYYCLLKQ